MPRFCATPPPALALEIAHILVCAIGKDELAYWRYDNWTHHPPMQLYAGTLSDFLHRHRDDVIVSFIDPVSAVLMGLLTWADVKLPKEARAALILMDPANAHHYAQPAPGTGTGTPP